MAVMIAPKTTNNNGLRIEAWVELFYRFHCPRQTHPIRNLRPLFQPWLQSANPAKHGACRSIRPQSDMSQKHSLTQARSHRHISEQTESRCKITKKIPHVQVFVGFFCVRGMIYHFFFFIKVSKSIYIKSKMQVCSSDPRFLSSPVPSICSERVTR